MEMPSGMKHQEPGAWLMRQKVHLPDPVAKQVRRAPLIHESVVNKRLTVLKAPAGFGKTTLLAECCRELQSEGVQIAWISLDERDVPATLERYLVLAGQEAGLKTEHLARSGDAGYVPLESVAQFMREVEALGRPFVLSLDGVDRLAEMSVAILNFLVGMAPANLHLALACRSLPSGLDIGGAFLDGWATVLSEDALRFTNLEIARFFNLKESSHEVAEIERETFGWPFAIRVIRERRLANHAAKVSTLKEFIANWLEIRLLSRIEDKKHDLILDLGLFDWFDDELFDTVLEKENALSQIRLEPQFSGLLYPVSVKGTQEAWKLHPLVRDYCIRKIYQNDAGHYASMQRRLATAYMDRGDTVRAVLHARRADDSDLVASVIESAGGVRMAMLGGMGQFLAVHDVLDNSIAKNHRGLALFRCFGLLHSGRLSSALQKYEEMDELGTSPAHRCDDNALLDDCFVDGDIALQGAGKFSLERIKERLERLNQFAEKPDLEPAVIGNIHYRLSAWYGLMAKFDAALMHADRAKQYFAGNLRMSAFVDLEIGQVAMAQGRLSDAKLHYERARDATRKGSLYNSSVYAASRTLLRELALERNEAFIFSEQPRVPRKLVAALPAASVYSAAAVSAVAITLNNKGPDRALDAITEMLVHLRKENLPSLESRALALRATVLAYAGRVTEAEQQWDQGNFPVDPAACASLADRSWREMEIVSLARLNLLMASGRFDQGRDLAQQLCALTEPLGLRRTYMHGLGFSILIEYRAGETEAACRHLNRYLSLYHESSIVGVLARHKKLSIQIIHEFLDTKPDPEIQSLAVEILAKLRDDIDRDAPLLNERERQILELLEGHQDKEIANFLGLSVHGVRYHLRNVFSKLQVTTRDGAIDHAKNLKLLESCGSAQLTGGSHGKNLEGG